MTELLIFPLIAIMLAGFLLVPWLTPLTATILLVFSYRKRRTLQSPVTGLLCIYGISSSLAFWFSEGLSGIEHVAGSPHLYVLPQAIVLFLAIREQRQFNLESYMKARIGFTLGLSAFALYIMALAAVMSAAA